MRTLEFPELSERARAAVEGMTDREEVERAYKEAVRNLSIADIQALEKNPRPLPGDESIILYAKALYRKAVSFSGVTFEKDGIYHPV